MERYNGTDVVVLSTAHLNHAKSQVAKGGHAGLLLKVVLAPYRPQQPAHYFVVVAR